MPSTQAIDAIAECLAEAEADSGEARISALRTLAVLTKLSSHNRDLLAGSPNALIFLLSLSASPSSPLTLSLSLSTLLHLSLNPNLKQPLASAAASIAGFLPCLHSLLLPSAFPEAATLAASLLCSLAMHDKNKAPLGVAGSVGAVVAALASPSPSAHHLLSCLSELVQFHGNCTLAVRAGAVPELVRILADDRGGDSAVVLGRMARFEEGMEAIRGVEGLAGLLVEALRRGCMVSRESAMELLVRLLEEGGEESMLEAAGKEDFSSLLADLAISGSTKLREKAGAVMKMMEESGFGLPFARKLIN